MLLCCPFVAIFDCSAVLLCLRAFYFSCADLVSNCKRILRLLTGTYWWRRSAIIFRCNECPPSHRLEIQGNGPCAVGCSFLALHSVSCFEGQSRTSTPVLPWRPPPLFPYFCSGRGRDDSLPACMHTAYFVLRGARPTLRSLADRWVKAQCSESRTRWRAD